jgi:hypothetical protein
MRISSPAVPKTAAKMFEAQPITNISPIKDLVPRVLDYLSVGDLSRVAYTNSENNFSVEAEVQRKLVSWSCPNGDGLEDIVSPLAI